MSATLDSGSRGRSVPNVSSKSFTWMFSSSAFFVVCGVRVDDSQQHGPRTITGTGGASTHALFSRLLLVHVAVLTVLLLFFCQIDPCFLRIFISSQLAHFFIILGSLTQSSLQSFMFSQWISSKLCRSTSSCTAFHMQDIGLDHVDNDETLRSIENIEIHLDFSSILNVPSLSCVTIAKPNSSCDLVA